MRFHVLAATLFFMSIFLLFGSSAAFANVPLTNAPVASSIGELLPPPGIATYSASTSANTRTIGILNFISSMVRLIMIIAGVWSTIMILLAGYIFISSSGDSGSYQKVRNQLTNAVVGLVIIMFTYTIVGLISLILFGDAGFILNPDISKIL